MNLDIFLLISLSLYFMYISCCVLISSYNYPKGNTETKELSLMFQLGPCSKPDIGMQQNERAFHL